MKFYLRMKFLLNLLTVIALIMQENSGYRTSSSSRNNRQIYLSTFKRPATYSRRNVPLKSSSSSPKSCLLKFMESMTFPSEKFSIKLVSKDNEYISIKSKSVSISERLNRQKNSNPWNSIIFKTDKIKNYKIELSNIHPKSIVRQRRAISRGVSSGWLKIDPKKLNYFNDSSAQLKTSIFQGKFAITDNPVFRTCDFSSNLFRPNRKRFIECANERPSIRTSNRVVDRKIDNLYPAVSMLRNMSVKIFDIESSREHSNSNPKKSSKSSRSNRRDRDHSPQPEESQDNSLAVQDLLQQSDIQSVWSFTSTTKGSSDHRDHRRNKHSGASGHHSEINSQEIKKLTLEIENFKVQIKNINSLLKESEAENTRLDHQTNILKDEVRRYQRNQERKEDIHNLEYLKNVIVRFIKSGPGDEKKQLLPVIDMMLKLNPGEKTLLEKIAVGENEEEDAEGDSKNSKSKSWVGGYIPRW